MQIETGVAESKQDSELRARDLHQCSLTMLRPREGTVCPLGDLCKIEHYVQDATLLKHMKDEHIMLLQHVVHDLERQNTERFTADGIGICKCDDGKCSIKVSHTQSEPRYVSTITTLRQGK
jgi:hypothetical protein